MTDTTAKIQAKGLKATGVTEELARKMYDALGSKHLAIVELTVDGRTEHTDGKQQVQLILTMVEPSTDPTLDDHLRELSRALHFNRQLHSPDEQLQIDTGDDIEPKVADVLAHGQALLTRDDDGEPQLATNTDPTKPHNYIDTADTSCGVTGCGLPPFAEVHLAATDDEPGAA